MTLDRRSGRFFIVAIALLASGCDRSRKADPRMLSEWMHLLYGAVRAERVSPPVASRLFAYSATALYAGLAAGDAQLPPLGDRLNGLPALPSAPKNEPTDPAIAAITAGSLVLDSLMRDALPTTRSAFARLADSLKTARLAIGLDPGSRERAEDVGRRIGLSIVAWSHGDGFDTTRGRKYVPPAGVGLWINDAPAQNFASQNISGASSRISPENPADVMASGSVSDRALILNRPKRATNTTLPGVNMAGATEPYWGNNRPFALRTADECVTPAAQVYSVDTASLLYRDARTVYDMSRRLTPEQKATVLYWADNGGESGTPAGHWLAITAQVAGEQRLSLEQTAKAMLASSIAIADAFIATWAIKYRVNLLRPRTYIRATMDSTWEPAIPTPPFPEFVSGHSAASAAAATALTKTIGDVAFVDSTSISIGHAARQFRSFSEAAHEAGLSRILGGIHFPTGNMAGRALGECIGEKVAERLGTKR